MGKNSNLLGKMCSLAISFTLLFQQAGFAQMAGQINLSSHLSGLSGAMGADKFRPVHLRYFSYDSVNSSFRL